MCEVSPDMQRKSDAIFNTADQLDDLGFDTAAQDLRMSVPPGEVIRRIEDTTERELAIPAVEILIELERVLAQ
jgi:hypothetical protein